MVESLSSFVRMTKRYPPFDQITLILKVYPQKLAHTGHVILMNTYEVSHCSIVCNSCRLELTQLPIDNGLAR